MTSPNSKPGVRRVVSIEEPESASPMMVGKNKDLEDFSLDRANPMQRSARLGRRLSGRVEPISGGAVLRPSTVNGSEDIDSRVSDQPPQPYSSMGDVFTQILGWIYEERRKKDARRRKQKTVASISKTFSGLVEKISPGSATRNSEETVRRASDASDSSLALEKLEAIIIQGKSLEADEKPKPRRKSSTIPRRPSSFRKLRSQSTVGSSDTEYQDDGGALVPSCEAVLDNTKTLMYPDSTDATAESQKGKVIDPQNAASKNREAWTTFKFEIVRLAHTLRLKGWRQVPMERSAEIDVERLSGALTNAVYVVSPPHDLDPTFEAQSAVPRRPPPKLLLRIYGPQVEHLIDRASELRILRRLARKKIGPRLLGTFLNGRFEEFFHARTLKPQDLRVPDTSKQIAKRMRELHDGIALLEEERDAGPFVWRNWDKWVERCERVVNFVDRLVLDGKVGSSAVEVAMKKRGLVCGVEWEVFRRTVEKYRRWLETQYGGPAKLREELVFAHNDTQYGNILRLNPPGESPLLLPANEHKQLVVIDFEYANANMRGLEFANHFTEWCYNYHDPQSSYACNTNHYPTPEEQQRFIRSYILHRPQFAPSASATPKMGPRSDLHRAQSSSLSTFTLDNRQPSSSAQYEEREVEAEAAVDAEVKRLMHETRLWRVANSAQWVAWGVVQARVPGLEEDDGETGKEEGKEGDTRGLRLQSDPLDEEVREMVQDTRDKRPEAETMAQMDEEVERGGELLQENNGDAGAEEDFDYLSYAQERALFFWGDVLALGLVGEEELPREVRERCKMLGY